LGVIASTDLSSSFQPGRAKTDATNRAATARQEALLDMELVRRFNAGDDTAFVEIMTRYRVRMFAIGFAMLKNRADAEEITQDTFIRAHRGLAKFRGDASLATWLHRIALNLSRNRYWYFFRRRRHATVSLDGTFNDDNPATFSDLLATDAADPAREAVTSEFSELVAACMERLGAAPREILILRNSLNRSYREIAEELGINVGTVKSRIARARANLRALLAEASPEFGSDTEPAAWFNSVRPAGGIEILCA
jgi:RNA polymerase sigma-70 factor (ECF subfamily)